MITEDDLRQVFEQFADEAPARCSSFDPAARRSGWRRRLRGVGSPAAGAVVALAAAACAVAVLPAIWSGHASSSGSGGGVTRTSEHGRHPTSARPVLPGFEKDIPPAMFTPTAAERRKLTRMGLVNGRANGDAHPRISVVGTTFDRLWNYHAVWVSVGSERHSVRSYHLASSHSRVWVLWERGNFDNGNVAMIDITDARTMRHGSGSYDADDDGQGVNPDQLANLGTVVTLR